VASYAARQDPEEPRALENQLADLRAVVGRLERLALDFRHAENLRIRIVQALAGGNG
jgi:hypothetical protein